MAEAVAEIKNVCAGVGDSRKRRGSRVRLNAAIKKKVIDGLIVCAVNHHQHKGDTDTRIGRTRTQAVE